MPVSKKTLKILSCFEGGLNAVREIDIVCSRSMLWARARACKHCVTSNTHLNINCEFHVCELLVLFVAYEAISYKCQKQLDDLSILFLELKFAAFKSFKRPAKARKQYVENFPLFQHDFERVINRASLFYEVPCTDISRQRQEH